MTFKPAIWYPIAIVLTVINVGGVWLATRPLEPWHATLHAVLAVAFGVWAHRLRRAPGGSDVQDRLEALEGEVSNLRHELGEANERLDFAERLLAREPEPRRLDPNR